MGCKSLSKTQVAFVGVTALLVLSYGTYHLTHRGTTSGIVELTAFVLLILALALPAKEMIRYHRLSRLQLLLIGTVAFIALVFGIYHLSTPDGKRSGVLELLSFALLSLTIFPPFRPVGNH